MPHEPAPWQLPDTATKHRVLDKYVRIMEAALQHMMEFEQVDPSRIGLLTWSYAGESALLLQMAHPEIRALTSLSSLSFGNGVYRGAEWRHQIRPEKLRSAILLLSERESPNGQIREVPAIFGEIRPNAYFVSFKESAHGNFNALEGMIPGVLNMNAVQPWSKGGETGRISYETVCRITLAFLDQYLGSDRKMEFRRQTDEIKKDVPPDFFTISQF